ncbi:MAG: phosphotransferase family protein [Candidatus Binatia bacterium]
MLNWEVELTHAAARTLLDAEAITCLFARLPALEDRAPRNASLAALWVKPGQHFNACYRLDIGDGRKPFVLGSAFALSPERAAKVAGRVGPHRPGRLGVLGCRHCNTSLVNGNLLLQLFPWDYRLPTLRACLDTSRVAEALDLAAGFSGCEPAGYRPGMRCQLRYQTIEGGVVFGKVAVERTPGASAAAHRRVHAMLGCGVHRVRVPPPLRYVPELGLALVAGVTGESLHHALHARRELGPEVEAAAAAIGDFHRLAGHGVERVYRCGDELELIHGWVRLVAGLFPQLAAVLRGCEAALVRSQPAGAAPRAFVHRDFYDKQVVLSPAGIVLLDLDTACQGDPEIDLGNFCAHLRLRGLQWGCSGPCATLEHRFVAAYPHAIRAARLAWYRRSALLRLACVYALRPRWYHLAAALLEGGA